MKNRISITDWCHERIRQLLPGKLHFCIDATAGTGRDTVFLASLMKERRGEDMPDDTGEKGRLIAFDIQEEAVRQTRERLLQEGLSDRAEVFCESHVRMDAYAKAGEVDIILFNLGYLPGGDHSLATKGSTTVEAVRKGLGLLKEGGVISLLIYSGGDSGFAEKEEVLAFLKTLPEKEYTVLAEAFYNKPNNPPLPVYIIKNHL